MREQLSLIATTTALLLMAACSRSPSPPEPQAAQPQPTASAAQAAASAPAPAEQWLQHRAAEAVVWGMPGVNFDLMRQQMLSKTQGKENQAIYWGRPLDWYNQTLTPLPSAEHLGVTSLGVGCNASERIWFGTKLVL